MGRKRSEEDKDDEDDEEDDEDEGFVDFRKRLFVRKFLFQDAWSNGYVSGRKNLYFFSSTLILHPISGRIVYKNEIENFLLNTD